MPKEYTDVLGLTSKERINIMVHDIVMNSMDKDSIIMSEHILAAMTGMRKFMFDNVYIDSKAKEHEEKSPEYAYTALPIF